MSSNHPALPEDTRHESGISRRAFLGAATGSIVVIPAAAGGFLITPTFASTAYADEPANTSAGETRLIIAKANQVGVTVFDMTKGVRKPIPDTKVTITSHATKKSVTATTDSKGVAMVDITDLAEAEGKNRKVPRYEFDGQIEVAKKGYRIFRAGRIHFDGAKGLPIPTRSIENGVPYPARVAFDDWDILYTNNEFAVAKGNVVKHTIDIEFENAGSSSMKVSLVSADNKEIATASAQPSGGKAKVAFKKLFLRAEHADALPIGKGFFLRYTQNGKTYQCPISLVTAKAVPGGDSAQAKPGLTLSPFGAEAMKSGVSVKIPKNWYVIGGMTFSPYIPEFKNVEYSFDPFGYFRVTFKSGEYGRTWKNKEGKLQSDGWMYSPRKTFKENSEKAWEDRGEMAEKVWNKANKGDKFFQTADLSHTIKLNVTGQAMIAGKWDDPSNLLRGMVRASATLTAKYSMSWQMMFGYVPVLLEFDIAAMFTLGFGAAFATPEVFGFSKWIWDYTNTGLDFTMSIIPSVSAGVGIKGIASVGVKVSATLTLFIGILSPLKLPEGTDKNGISYPHVIFGFNWSISVVIMLLGHTWTPLKWDPHKYPEAYNNWKGGWQPPFSGGTINAQAEDDEINFESLLNEAKIITQASLSETAEFNRSSTTMSGSSTSDSDGSSMSAQAESDTQSFVQYEIEEEDACVPLADGTPIRYRVLSLVEKQDDDDGKRWLAAASPSTISGKSSATNGKQTMTASGSNATTMRANEDQSSAIPYGDHHNDKYKMPNASVKTLASEQGLIPDSDIMLAYNVVSDTRAKVVTVCGLPMMFRIASCLVAPVYNSGNHITPDHWDPRMRVCATSLSGNSNDFKNWVFLGRNGRQIQETQGAQTRDPEDLYDYDFAVCVEHEKPDTVDWDTERLVTYVHLFVISGFRQNGDSTSLQDVAADQVLTYAKYKFSRDLNKRTNVSSNCTSTPVDIQMVSSGYYSNMYAPEAGYQHHNFSCPHINLIEDEFNGGKYRALYMSFLDRATTEDDKKLLFSTSKQDVDICLGTMFFDPDAKSLIIPNSVDVRPVTGPIQDYSVFEMTCTERIGKGWHVLMLRGNTHTHYLSLQTNAHLFVKETGKFIPALTDATYMETRNDKLRLVKWKGHEGFLASVGGDPDPENEKAKSGAKLQHVTISGLDGTGEKRFSYKDIGPDDFNVKTFDVDPTGQFVFYPATRSGTDYGSYTDGGATNTAGEDVETHRIMACKLRNGKFSDPFVFAEIVHPIDSLTVFSEDSSAMAFVSTHVTDADKGKADIWITSMPHVRSATVVQCSTVTPYAFPGEQAQFDVAVRNDGNVHLSGFTANLCEKGAKSSSKVAVTFSKDSLVESSWNPADENGVLQEVEPDYSLAPGAISVYRVAMTVPDGWSGTKTVAITASDAIAAPASGASAQSADSLTAQSTEMSAQADDDFDEWYIDYMTVLDTYPTDELLIPVGDEVDSEELDDAPVTVVEPEVGGAGDNGGDTGSNGGDTGGNKNNGSTPKTGDSIGKLGDPVSGLELAATALAAVGAAFAAYSTRRVALESGEEPNGMIDVDACASDSDRSE